MDIWHLLGISSNFIGHMKTKIYKSTEKMSAPTSKDKSYFQGTVPKDSYSTGTHEGLYVLFIQWAVFPI